MINQALAETGAWPPAKLIIGFGLAQLAYIVFGFGLLRGRFGVFGLERRWQAVSFAIAAFIVGTYLVNV